MQSEQRLHPATLLFDLITHVRRFALPAVLVMFGASRSNDWPMGRYGYMSSGWEWWLMVLLVPAALMTIARYVSFRIRYDDRELVLRSGLIFRNERHVPYARIQNLDAIQNPLHQLLHVVEVRVETGGGKEEEARLSVLSLAAFEEMKTHVLAGRTQAGAAIRGGNPSGLPEQEEVEPVITGEPLVHLSLREVLLCGLLENKGMVLIGAAAGIGWETGLFRGVSGRLFGQAQSMGWGVFRDVFRSVTDGTPFPLLRLGSAIALVVGVLLFIRLVSMAWALVRLYDFRLLRDGNDLRSTFGLFTRVATTVPIKRVQTVIVSAGPVHRWLGRVTVRVETAGGHGAKSGESGAARVREWLAPLLHRHELPTLLRQVLPGVDVGTLPWQPLHPRAFARALKPNLAVTALVTIVAAIVIGWGAVGVLILLMPWAILSARQYVRHVAWTENDEVVAMRSGWIWQQMTIARVNKIQAVALRHSPLDRRAAMARVRVDTAGAGEFTRIDIPYLDGDVALGLHNRLAAHAANTAFRW
jgi:putative membrane protein